MKALVFNEMEKLVKSKLLYIAVLLTILFSVFAVYQQGNLLRDFSDRDPKTIAKQIQTLEEKLKDPALTEEKRKVYNHMLSSYHIALDSNKRKQEAFQMEGQRPDILEAERLEADYLKNNGINQEDLYARNNYTLLFRVLAANEFVVIFLIVALLGGYIISSEYQPDTIKLLLTRATSRWKILAAKYITLLLSTTFVAFIAIAVTILLGGVRFGWGDANYPVTIGARFTFDGNPVALFTEGSTQVIPRYLFAAAASMHAVFVCIVTATLAFAVSSVVPRKVLALILSFMGVIGIFMLSIVSDTRSMMGLFNFMSYLTLAPIWSGSLLSKVMNGNVTFGFSAGILVAWMGLSLALSFSVFTRRDILA